MKQNIICDMNNNMAALSLQEEEMLCEKVKAFPILYDKGSKGYKEKDAVNNAWEKVSEELDFVGNGKFLLMLNNFQMVATSRCIIVLFEKYVCFFIA